MDPRLSTDVSDVSKHTEQIGLYLQLLNKPGDRFSSNYMSLSSAKLETAMISLKILIWSRANFNTNFA